MAIVMNLLMKWLNRFFNIRSKIKYK